MKKVHYCDLKKRSKSTQTKTLSTINKRPKEEQTIHSKKNTKKPKVTLYSLPELSKGSKIRKTILWSMTFLMKTSNQIDNREEQQKETKFESEQLTLQ